MAMRLARQRQSTTVVQQQQQQPLHFALMEGVSTDTRMESLSRNSNETNGFKQAAEFAVIQPQSSECKKLHATVSATNSLEIPDVQPCKNVRRKRFHRRRSRNRTVEIASRSQLPIENWHRPEICLPSSSSSDDELAVLDRNANQRDENGLENEPPRRLFKTRGATARRLQQRRVVQAVGHVGGDGQAGQAGHWMPRLRSAGSETCLTKKKLASSESDTDFEKPPKRALSVRNLDGSMTDFTDPNSVNRWASSILTELQSLPSLLCDDDQDTLRGDSRDITPTVEEFHLDANLRMTVNTTVSFRFDRPSPAAKTSVLISTAVRNHPQLTKSLSDLRHLTPASKSPLCTKSSLEPPSLTHPLVIPDEKRRSQPSIIIDAEQISNRLRHQAAGGGASPLPMSKMNTVAGTEAAKSMAALDAWKKKASSRAEQQKQKLSSQGDISKSQPKQSNPTMTESQHPIPAPRFQQSRPNGLTMMIPNGHHPHSHDQAQNRRSVHGIVRSLIQAAENSRRETTTVAIATSPSPAVAIYENIPCSHNSSLLLSPQRDAETQTSPSAQSCTSSFEYLCGEEEAGNNDPSPASPVFTPITNGHRHQHQQQSKKAEPIYESPPDIAENAVRLRNDDLVEQQRSESTSRLEMEIDASLAMLLEQVNSLYSPATSSTAMSTPSPISYRKFPTDERPKHRSSYGQGIQPPTVPLHRQSKSAVIRNLRRTRDASLLTEESYEKRRIASYDNLANGEGVEAIDETDQPASAKRECDDAAECCQWLRDAGFPQYAKQYEENRFPIDLRTVHSDHEFLDRDSLMALYRRLRNLNQFSVTSGAEQAKMRQKKNRSKQALLDSDESMLDDVCDVNKDEEEVAISRRWRYVRQSKSWSRVLDPKELEDYMLQQSSAKTIIPIEPVEKLHESSLSPSPVKTPDVPLIHETVAADSIQIEKEQPAATPAKGLRRSQSERIKDRAREFVKRMDIRSTNRKKPSQPPPPSSTARSSVPAPIVIGEPTLVAYSSASPQMMRMFTPEMTKRKVELKKSGETEQLPHLMLFQSPTAIRRVTAADVAVKAVDEPFGSPLERLETKPSPVRRPHRRRGIMVEEETRSLTDPSSSTSSLASSRIPGSDDTAQRIPLTPKMGVQMSNANREQVIAIVHRDASDVEQREKSNQPKSITTLQFAEIKKNRTNVEQCTAVPDSPYDNDNERTFFGKHTRTNVARPQLVVNADGYYTHVVEPESYTRLSFDSNRPKLSPKAEPRHSPFSRSTGRSQSSLESGIDDSPALQRGERRDSGVGSSLSRSPSGPTSERQRYSMLRIQRVPSSPTSTETVSPTQKKSMNVISAYVVSDPIPESDLLSTMDALPVSTIIKMRKMAYLKLTALFERSSPTVAGGMMSKIGSTTASSAAKNWTNVQKLMQRLIAHDARPIKRTELVFGAPLMAVQQIDGTALPLCILNIMRYLRQMAACTDGLFRKSGVRSRVTELRNFCEAGILSGTEAELNRCLKNFQVHDVADLLKQYFRELPEPLLTAKYSDTFMNIFTNLPPTSRIEATQYALLLLPDEHREALQTLIFFLQDIGRCSNVTNMNADSLAICFSPSLFQIGGQRFNAFSGNRRHKTVGAAAIPSSREFRELHAAQLCLKQMIDQGASLFVVPIRLRMDSTLIDEGKQLELPLLNQLGSPNCDYSAFLLQKSKELLKEHRNRWKGWLVESVHDGIEISTRKSVDWHPLPLIRAWTDISAPPRELLACIMRDRSLWDSATINWRIFATLNDNCEIYQYVLNDTPGHPTRDIVVVRQWRYDMRELRGGCILVERSLAVSETQLLGGFSAALIDSRFLIEPYAGRSRLTHISRLDLRGRSLSWYTNVYAYRIAKQLATMRGLFQKMVGEGNSGPETKV